MNGAGGNGSEGRRILRVRLVLLASLGVFLVGLAVFLVMMASPRPDQANTITEGSTPGGANPTGAAPNTPTPVGKTGLVVYGYVRAKDGKGVENVQILRRLSGYPGQDAYTGELLATTNTDGYYQSDFYFIPGDEMVMIWAEGEGLRFTPEYYYWRHYHSYEITQYDFTVR